MSHKINLLPPAELREIRLTLARSMVFGFGIRLVLSLAALSVLLFSIMIYLQAELKSSAQDLSAQSLTLTNLESEGLQDKLRLYNQNLSNFQKLYNERQLMSRVLETISENMPADMTVERLDVDLSAKKIEIKGRAGNRNSVLEFRRSLISSDIFANVNFPLDNLEKASDGEWSYRFFINPKYKGQIRE